MDINQLHDIKMKLAILLSIVNDFDVDTDEQDEYIDYMHMHLNDAMRYLSYLMSEVEQ
jgi:hypothetical protein